MDIFIQKYKNECGYICIKFICLHFRKNYIFSEIFGDKDPCIDKLNLLSIKNTLQSIGIKSQGAQYNPYYLAKVRKFFGILHVNNEHFICVLKEQKKNDSKVVIVDPQIGLYFIEKDLLVNFLKNLRNENNFINCLMLEI